MKARPVLIGAAVILAIGTGGLYAYAQSQKPLLQLGVGYAARVACGCRYIGNRPLADCAKDFEPGMEQIRLSENAATKTITASVPLLVSRAATFDPVLGCQPEPLGGRKPNGFPIAALPPLAAILPDSQRPNILKQCSRSVPANGEAGWKPSASDIAALEAKLPAFLATEKVNVAPLGDKVLAESARQYVGIVRGRKRFIYGNFFPASTINDNPNWHSLPEMVCDGGPDFFGVEYDVQADRFTRADFNGHG